MVAARALSMPHTAPTKGPVQIGHHRVPRKLLAVLGHRSH